jgi:phosphatidylglycerophosphate synthase
MERHIVCELLTKQAKHFTISVMKVVVMVAIKNLVRKWMRALAKLLNRISGGRITPNGVTLVGCAMHVPIGLLIATRHNLWAATLLTIFGLFDTLDGELARLQDRASVRGMLLDASTDRFKEVLLYSGTAYALALGSHPGSAAWAAAACGASLSVSYVKAKGEAAVASGAKTIPHATLNRMFADGLLTFEIRMALLILGLLVHQLLAAVIVIAVLASYTAVQRLVRISQKV